MRFYWRMKWTKDGGKPSQQRWITLKTIITLQISNKGESSYTNKKHYKSHYRTVKRRGLVVEDVVVPLSPRFQRYAILIASKINSFNSSIITKQEKVQTFGESRDISVKNPVRGFNLATICNLSPFLGWKGKKI